MVVDVNFRLVNESDPFTRIFGVWVDRTPPEGWTQTLDLQNTATIKQFVQSGASVDGALDLSDGKHTIYVAISQTQSKRLAAWTVDATFDGVKAPTLAAIDWDTVGRYDVEVKNGKVVSQAGEAGQELDDINNDDRNRVIETVSKVKSEVSDGIKKVVNKIDENRKESGIIAAATAGFAIAVTLISNKRGRRF